MAPEGASAPSVFKIRHFQPSDAPALSNILLDSPEAAQSPLHSYLQLTDSPQALVLVCELDSKKVQGFLAARQIPDEAEILNLAVHSSSRRKGIASALLRAAIA